MTATETQLQETELQRIERWRAAELERGGYPARDAARIAERHDIDLHFAVELLDRGCSPELATQILL